MQITQGNDFISITADRNIISYATGDYRHADMSSYNIEAPTAKELRELYEAAQRIYWNMITKRHTVKECEAARKELANKYMRYKEALITAYEKRA